jgi:hypothetical protein
MPASYKDFLKQRRRFERSGPELSRSFGDWVLKEYKIDKKYLIQALLLACLKYPLQFLIYCSIMIFSKFQKSQDIREGQGAWMVSESTKEL